MTCRIRRMKIEDSGQVGSLFEACFSDPWSLESIKDMFDRPGYYNLVAEAGDRIIGYIGILAVMDEADITNVAVSPDWRRRHVADRLIAALLALAGEEGIQQIFLEVRRSNRAARALYEKAGFTEAGCRKNYYQHPVEDAVIMIR